MTLYGSLGKPIHLVEPAITHGGEGAIYKIRGHPQLLVKLYHSESDAKLREQKIDAMLKIAETSSFKGRKLYDKTAWPLGAVYDKNRNFKGFGMSMLQATTDLKEIQVYPPKNNSLSYKQKLQVLINLCSLVEGIHNLNICIGDMNPDNFMVQADLSVVLVDTDSLHLSANKAYRCIACAPGLSAPELIKKVKGYTYEDAPGATFTQYTDNFALAVHIFTTLMNCHPYAYRKDASSSFSKSTNECIEAGDSPFFKNIPGVSPPAFALSLSCLPNEMQKLFRRAFVDGNKSPSNRPNPGEWKSALQKFSGELNRCAKNHNHYYLKTLSACPYCSADNALSSANKAALVKVQPTPSPQRSPAAVPSPAPAATQTTPPSAAKPSRVFNPLFWIATLLLTGFCMYSMTIDGFPALWSYVLDDYEYIYYGVIASAVSGVIGSLAFNFFWAPGRYTGKHDITEYCLSLLCGIGFSLAAIPLGLVAALILYILAAIFLIVMIAIFAEIFS